MNLYLFVALIEVRPTSACEFLDVSEVAGAFVRCYVPASDEASARLMLQRQLAQDGLQHVDESWFVRDDEVEWENPDDPTADEMGAEAMTSQQVVYGEFETWGHDAPDADDDASAPVTH